MIIGLAFFFSIWEWLKQLFSIRTFLIVGPWEITGFVSLSTIWQWLEQLLSTWTYQPIGQFLDFISILCAAAARGINHDRGEWGVVIREPPQAENAPTLVGLPAELTDMVVAFCEPMPRNAIQHAGVDYLFQDRLHRDGKRRIISGPSMLGLAQTNRQLRYFQTRQIYKNKVLRLSHEDVGKTLYFLAELYPSVRDCITGLHIEWQRTKPLDQKEFRRLCGVLDNMPELSVLHLTLPINKRKPYPALLDPGLRNALVWHKDKMLWDFRFAFEILRGFGFSPSRHASWVTHLLGIRGARTEGKGFQDFRLETIPRAEGAGLRPWLDNKMTLEWEDKVAAVERIKRERGWVGWMLEQHGIRDRLYDLYYILKS